MFNRQRKITALLLVAAAVVSVIPATKVSAASKKLTAKDGTIYNAVPYKDGKFYIDGGIEKKDDAVYYLNNGKYTELKDIDSEDKIKEYGTKYLEVEDGDYYVDLSSGKVLDSKVRVDSEDEVAVNLRKEVKDDNDGRFSDDDAKNVKDVTELPKAKFGDTWYKAEYKVKSADEKVNGGASTINVYTDANGKYVDGDYNLGTIKVKLSNSKTAKIENTNDADEGVRAKVTDVKEIGQDSNNIYRLAKITLKADSGVTISEINGEETSNKIFTLVDSGNSVSFEVIQKLSKSQSSKDIDGIKYSKSVDSYILADKDGDKVDLLSSDADTFSIVSGKILDYKVDGDSVEVQTLSLKSKSTYYYVEAADSAEQDLQNGEDSFDVDANGNLWALSDEAIYKFNNDEDWKEVYKVDDSLENLSVYDDNNLVAWNEEDELYSIVSGKVVDEDKDEDSNNSGSDNSNNNSNVTTGWVKGNDNTWTYVNSDGTKATGWLNLGGTWYYLDTNGIMKTGWQSIGGTWYYLEGSGAMKTGWAQVGGSWYYMQPSGAMKTGWLNDNGTWYYLNASGVMLSNTTIDGCKLGANGAWVK